ncbi:hypothetical protein [Ammonifex thiophilus]|uniref:Uncharacterized protein n=1 Tax=Ammonifex thiophilus TaxID=444093 RepID=A0A3D8P411_9THEO|nr:hypothetical protein [Ammonifex thiophilus]RDV81790.1 hypothetical protein DXX99_08800 [Ammonifex thiophilus]
MNFRDIPLTDLLLLVGAVMLSVFLARVAGKAFKTAFAWAVGAVAAVMVLRHLDGVLAFIQHAADTIWPAAQHAADRLVQIISSVLRSI